MEVNTSRSLLPIVLELGPVTLSSLKLLASASSCLTSRLINLSTALSGHSKTVWPALEALYTPIITPTDLGHPLPTRLSALSAMLSKAANTRQLAHEYALHHCTAAGPPPPSALVDQLQHAVDLLLSEIQRNERKSLGVCQLALRLQKNRRVVGFLQPLIKLVFFVLSEASLEERRESEISVASLLISLLMHKDDQVCYYSVLFCRNHLDWKIT